jgi:hypothetical protein
MGCKLIKIFKNQQKIPVDEYISINISAVILSSLYRRILIRVTMQAKINVLITNHFFVKSLPLPAGEGLSQINSYICFTNHSKHIVVIF